MTGKESIAMNTLGVGDGGCHGIGPGILHMSSELSRTPWVQRSINPEE